MRIMIVGLFVVALGQTGCAFSHASRGVVLTPEEVDQFGTKAFAAPAPKVFAAVTGALKGQGFEIAVEEPNKGIIKTSRRLIRSASRGHAYGGNGAAAYSSQAIDYTRSYTVRLRAKTDGSTSVSLTPHVFAGEQDLSDGQVWVIEGDEGERTLWNRLFKDIAELL